MALEDLRAGDSAHYAVEYNHSVTYMLGGGVPSTYVTFVFGEGVDPKFDAFANPKHAVWRYIEHESVYVAVPDGAVVALYRALRTYGA
jgi:hypothetical protein